MSRYGVPYTGSKNGIAKKIVEILPAGERFVDLFAGGCAVTHACMESRKWARFHANDISDAPSLFLKSVNGGLRNETRWISREEFLRLKDSDPYIRYCWSFGNKGNSYLYAEEIEPLRKANHFYIVQGDDSLFHMMDIFPPEIESGSNIETRNRILTRFFKENSAQVKTKYIKYWLELVDEKKRNFEQIYGYVLRGVVCGQKAEEEAERLRGILCNALKVSGLTQSEVNRRLGTQMAGHYFGRSQWEFPTLEEYRKLKAFLPLPDDYFELTNYYTILERLESLQRLERLESLQRLQSLQRLERLESLQRLQRLESLQRLQRLEITQMDYRHVPILPGDVVYCDIPYKNTATDKTYGADFSHDDFYAWTLSRDFPVFVSEYQMPAEDFTPIFEIRKNSMLNSNNKNIARLERVFVQSKFAEQFQQKELQFL